MYFLKKVCIAYQRWVNVDPTLPHKLKAWGKYVSKYIHWANGGPLLVHKTYFSLEFIKFVWRWPNVGAILYICQWLANCPTIFQPFQRWANIVMLFQKWVLNAYWNAVESARFLFGHFISACSQLSGRYLSVIVQNAVQKKKMCWNEKEIWQNIYDLEN